MSRAKLSPEEWSGRKRQAFRKAIRHGFRPKGTYPRERAIEGGAIEPLGEPTDVDAELESLDR